MAALRSVLQPLVALAVQRGLSYATVEEMVRRAFVGAADAAHPDLLPHRKVSRLSTTTGINRREVARLLGVLRDAQASQQLPRRSLASEVFAHWMSDARYRDRRGAAAGAQAPGSRAELRIAGADDHPRRAPAQPARRTAAPEDSRCSTTSTTPSNWCATPSCRAATACACCSTWGTTSVTIWPARWPTCCPTASATSSRRSTPKGSPSPRCARHGSTSASCGEA